MAGISLGLLLGEIAAPFDILADAYVRLLQMTVLPYMIVALISGIGSLEAAQAKTMLTRVGAVLVLLWAVSIGFAFLMPLTFPSWETASFFSTSQLHQVEPFDFLSLYIPTNPFYSLANNVVPAVVLFCVVAGVALIGVKDKEKVLGPMHTAARTIGQINHFVVKLTPIGLFAIGASLAGTLRLDDLERIQIYLIAYGAVALLLMLWVLPGLVTVLTPARYREVVGPARDALLTAFMTGSLFVVLPMLGECAREILERHAGEHPEAQDYPDVIVPASFNFPHSAKLLSLSFIPFAAWFSEAAVGGIAKYVQLAVVGLLSFFGSLNAAVPYLLDVFRIPHDTFQLFLATGVVNSRVGSAVAAMHTLVVAILGSFALAGLMRVRKKKLVRYLVLTAALTAGTIGGLRLLFGVVFEPAYAMDEVLASMHRIRGGVEAVVHREALPPLDEREALLQKADASPEGEGESSLLARVRARGVLRVAYTPDNPPYSFFNGEGDLVGFDVEMAHELARTLGVTLEFVPVDILGIRAHVAAGASDIVMSGVVITPERAEELAFSVPYLEEHVAFLTADHRRSEFATRERVRSTPGLRFAVLPVSYVVEELGQYAPDAEIVPFENREELFQFIQEEVPGVDAVVLTAERGAIRSLLYPHLSVVVPDPEIVTIPLAYVVGEGDERFRLFLNTWLDILGRDGTIGDLRDYWIYGKNAQPRKPRWSVIRDVLGWVD